MTEIIVYRNPAEAALWQMLSGGEFFPVFAGAIEMINIDKLRRLEPDGDLAASRMPGLFCDDINVYYHLKKKA